MSVRTSEIGKAFSRVLAIVLVPLAIAAVCVATQHLPAWLVMWILAAALFAACKALAFRRATAHGFQPGRGRALGFLLLWPGMDAPSFLQAAATSRRPAAREWCSALRKTALGAAVVWAGARVAEPYSPLAAPWIGMAGLILLLHFGTFHLVALAWQAAGVQARPIMDQPLHARSLSEFWGQRWNLGFHDLASAFVFRPLKARLGPTTAMLAVFGASGLVHDLVISLPAGGGFGLPTLYFLAQGAGILTEHSRLGRCAGLGRGWRGRAFAGLVVAAPAFWLFHPWFVQRVMLPFLHAISAL